MVFIPPAALRLATDVLCATYVDADGVSLCDEGSILEPDATCGDDDECSQSECCLVGESVGYLIVCVFFFLFFGSRGIGCLRRLAVFG